MGLIWGCSIAKKRDQAAHSLLYLLRKPKKKGKRKNPHTYTLTYICIRTCRCLSVFMCMYIYTHLYVYIHKHTHCWLYTHCATTASLCLCVHKVFLIVNKGKYVRLLSWSSVNDWKQTRHKRGKSASWPNKTSHCSSAVWSTFSLWSIIKALFYPSLLSMQSSVVITFCCPKVQPILLTRSRLQDPDSRGRG